jgi:hypothetical protein
MPRVTEGGASVRPINEPSEGQPTPTSKPPKAQQPPQAGQSQTPFTSAVQARPLPILWGTDKIVPYLIEKLPTAKRQPANWAAGVVVSKGEIQAANGNAYEVLKGGTTGGGNSPSSTGADPTAWVVATVYALNDVRKANGNAYQCSKAGTSGAVGTGPSGTGTNIIDNLAQWAFLSVLPYPVVNTGDGIIWRYIQATPYPLYFQQFVGALCEGEILGVLRMWWNKERLVCPSLDRPGKGLACFFGPDAANQSISTAGTGYPWDDSSYQHTALISPVSFAAGGVPSGTQEEMPDIALETQGILFGATTLDARAADIVNDVLTHVRRGCGWPSGRVDATTITGAGAASYATYCDAAGLRFSYYLDTATTALAVLTDILNATNSDAFWSGGALKIVPLADTSITAPVYGGVNYVPSNTAQYNLTVDDLMDVDRPVQVSRRSDADCFNCYPIEYKDRSADYATITVEDPDQTDIETRGSMKRAGTVSLPMVFQDGTRPIMLSRNLAQRSLNIRNTYTFRLPWRFILLEPTDIVTLPPSALGDTGTTPIPVRITQLRENEDETITFTAEDYPQGVAASVPFVPQANDGLRPNEFITTSAGPNQVDGFSLGVKSGALVSAHVATSMLNFGNYWPNPTSEVSPPVGVSVLDDGSSSEWDFRVNVGPSPAAYAGIWVREMTRTTAGTSLLRHRVPASPGETYTFKNQHRYIATAGTPTAKTKVTFYDKDFGPPGGLSGSGSATHPVPGVPPGSWTPTAALTGALGVPLVAPSDTAYVEFALELVTAGAGTATIRWDALNAYKVISSDDLGSSIVTPDKLVRVSAIYTTNAGQSIPDSAWTTVDFGTSEKLSGFVTTGASWHFSTPGAGPPSGAGLYLVTAEVTINTGGAGAPVDAILRIVKAGVELQRGNRMTGNGPLLGLQLSAMIQCAATEQFHVDIWQANIGAACSLEAIHASNRICIVGPIDD